MKIVFTLQNICIPVGVHMFFLFNTNISIPISPNDPNDPTRSLNLPRIATQSILGLNRLRLSIVYMGISSAFGLHDFPLFHRAVKLSRVE